MPRRLVKQSREDPARAVLGMIGLVTLIAQGWAMFLTVPWYYGAPNFMLAAPFAIWAMWATSKGNVKHMARSSFALFLMWTWTALTRLIIVEGVGELLWVPFLITGLTLGITYLHFSYKKRQGDLD